MGASTIRSRPVQMASCFRGALVQQPARPATPVSTLVASGGGGSLGTGDTRNSKVPREVPYFSSRKVKMVRTILPVSWSLSAWSLCCGLNAVLYFSVVCALCLCLLSVCLYSLCLCSLCLCVNLLSVCLSVCLCFCARACVRVHECCQDGRA